MNLKKRERSVYSQAGQDGVIEAIFETIGTTNKFFVEFGAGDGLHLSNTANLRHNHSGWCGLLMDSVVMARHKKIVNCEHVSAENIEELLLKYGVPKAPDYLSIDMDGNDYWVWKAILDGKKFRPRVVSIEFNSNFGPDRSVTIPYNPAHNWDGTQHYGASLTALYKLGVTRGYKLVHIVENLDAFFVDQNDSNCLLLPARCPEDFSLPIPCHPETNRPWIEV